MAEQEPEEQPAEFEVQVPPELEPGAYANFLGVWHTPHEFTLDFAVTQPAQSDGETVRIPCRVVSRVKIPVTVLFDMLRALNDNMTKYEETFGMIHRPGDPGDEDKA